MTLYHNGRKTRSFHRTKEGAIRAKKAAEKLQKKEGSRAWAFNREAQVEYEEAKRLIGDGARLSDVVRAYLALKSQPAKERKTLNQAVSNYADTKQKLGRSRAHYLDVKERLEFFAAAFEQGERGIHTLSANDVLTWLLALKGNGLSARTVWNYYGAIAGLFKHAERRDWLENNPVKKINPKAELPTRRKGLVQILSLKAGEAFLRLLERSHPEFIAWGCIQYFLGVRAAEAERFRGEWIDAAQKRIRIPGWFAEGDAPPEGVAKTRDDWVIDDAPAAFWSWVKRYPDAFAKGPILYPSWKTWSKICGALIEAGHFAKWPHNGLRHSFATYHLSAFRNPGRTSLILRHQNSRKLHSNYLGEMVSREIGRAYLSVGPTEAGGD